MATTITGKLNKAASEFQAGESTGFGVRLGVQYYDRDTQSKQWTNYEAVVFARQQGQIDFYRNALVEGAVVQISANEEKIDVFEGNNGPMYSIKLLNASLGFVHTPQNAAPQQPQQPVQPTQQQYQQQPQQQYQQQAQPHQQYQSQQPQQFESDIPF